MRPEIRRLPAIIAAALGPGGPALAGNPVFDEIAVDLGVAAVHNTAGYVHADYTGGGAVGDFNNDGCQDLFVISGGVGNVPDHLYINNCNGTFTDRAAEWGLGTAHLGKGASVGDFNKDGWLDLYVTSAGPVGGPGPGHHKLYRNNGNGTFTNVAASAGVNTTAPAVEDGFGSTWGDYDLDGDLDLFVGGFANFNVGSKLFRNNGDETFTNVTGTIGLFTGVPFTLALFSPRFADMDGDRWPDLLLAADFGTSRYFRNDGDGTFTDLTVASGTGDEENGMGQTVGDLDNNGLLDWYVTSIYYPQNSWTGNKLYLNVGNHLFFEFSNVYGVYDGGYGWGTVAVDFNHDGRLDIAETNGDSQPSGPFFNEQSYLWVANAGGTFTEMALATGFAHFGKGRGMVNFDYDNDGDQDVVIFAYNERLYLFRNDIAGAGSHWLRVFLDTSNAPGLAPGGTGARVRATVGAQTQMRYLTSGDNFLSHSELSAHFGLGAAAVVDEVSVEWPDGTTTTLNDVAADQTIVISTGEVPGDTNGDGDVNVTDLLALLGAWGACQGPCPPSCPADFDDNCEVNVTDLLIMLGNWS